MPLAAAVVCGFASMPTSSPATGTLPVSSSVAELRRRPTIESHWPAFSEVFHYFDPTEVAAMTERDIDQAAQNPRTIRNRRKVHASVTSAAVNEVIAQYGCLDAYLRSFDSPEKENADLQHRFAGLGDYSAWWFMQSVGLPVPPTD